MNPLPHLFTRKANDMSTVNPALTVESIILDHVNLDDVINVQAIYERVNEFLNGKLDIAFDEDYVKRLVAKFVLRLILNDKAYDPSFDYM